MHPCRTATSKEFGTCCNRYQRVSVDSGCLFQTFLTCNVIASLTRWGRHARRHQIREQGRVTGNVSWGCVLHIRISEHAIKAVTHAVPCHANSHIPCRALAVFRHCRVLRKSPRVAGKIRTGNRKTPRGSRKKPNLGRSSTGRLKTADVNSHIPCRAVPCRGLQKSLQKLHGRSTVWYV